MVSFRRRGTVALLKKKQASVDPGDRVCHSQGIERTGQKLWEGVLEGLVLFCFGLVLNGKEF